MPIRACRREKLDDKILKTQKKTAMLLSTFIAAASLSFLPTASAADGDLDTTFGTGGIATTHLGSLYDYGESVALQSDGKIVTAGYFYNGTDYDFALVRYNNDGTLDTSFSGDGIVTTDIGNLGDFATSIAIQSDGKIIVAGNSLTSGNYKFALVRYNTDGTLDTSFSGDGKVTTSIGSLDDFASAIAIQGDGKIVVTGYSNNATTSDDFAVVRYNTDGTPDTTFSGDGIVTTALGVTNDRSYSIAIQTNGKIVVAGYSNNASTSDDFAVVRYNTDGTLDTSFSGDGKVTTALGVSDDRFYSIGLQSDGKIVAAGSSYDDTGSIFDFALVRYNTDGTSDSSFSGDGIVTTSVGASSQILSIALQSDGKIVAAGYSYTGSGNTDFALVRYNTDGTSDSSFSGDGKVITAISGLEDSATSVVLQSDGKIVAAGYSYNVDTSIDFTLVRYVASDSAAEAARIAAAAEAAKKAKEQKELTELLSVIPSIAGLALNVGDLANSLLTTKCVKGKVIKYVYKGAKCPKGYVKKK